MAMTMISFQVKEEERDALIKAAEAEMRSLSNFVRSAALRCAKNDHGIEPVPEEA